MIGSKHTIRKKPARGFALLVAIVLSSVAALVTLSLTNIAYKNLLLSSAAKESQYAFYTADTALECALYWDKGANNKFPVSNTPASPSITCNGITVNMAGSRSGGYTIYKSQSSYNGWFPISDGATEHCARIMVYKSTTAGNSAIYADGTNVSCANSVANPLRATERGLKAVY